MHVAIYGDTMNIGSLLYKINILI